MTTQNKYYIEVEFDPEDIEICNNKQVVFAWLGDQSGACTVALSDIKQVRETKEE